MPSRPTRRAGTGSPYSATLVRLGAACPGSTVGFLSTDLSGTDPAQKSGFTVTLAADGGAQGTDCNNQAGVGGYYVTATPVNFGTIGNRSFASNTVGHHLLRQRGGASDPGADGPGRRRHAPPVSVSRVSNGSGQRRGLRAAPRVVSGHAAGR